MKAVVCRQAELRVADLPDPLPGRGQVVLRVKRCGICGSDLHARHHCDHWADLMVRDGLRAFVRSTDDVVFGHEFCGEVLDYGPDTRRRLPAGTLVCAVPLQRHGDAVLLTGLSVASPGAYAERVVVEESLMTPVPNGLAPDLAALTEPMAVAWHAVRRGEVGREDVAVVVGCGPVGLGVICALKARGAATIVASDFSAGRRELARRCGADVVVNPAEQSPFRA